MNGRPPTVLRVLRTRARLEEGDGDLLSARLDLPDLATIGPSDAIEALDSALLVAGSCLLFVTADEYAVHGQAVRTGRTYDNHYVSVITIKDRKVAHWRDYLDPVAIFNAIGWPAR